MNQLSRLLWIGATLCVLTCSPAHAVVIEFDYTYDQLGFFDDPQRRETLELAGKLVNRFVDPLSPIAPDETNTWSIFPALPPKGSNRFLENEHIPANTVKVFVGGNDVISERKLAETSFPGPISLSGPADWEDTINFRDQFGASQSPATDYGPWGGVIMFNANPDDVPWHVGTTTDGLEPHEFDLLTVAMHELMHIFGFGPAESFQALVDGDRDALQFVGPTASALAGTGTNNTDLDMYDGGHWAIDTFGVLADRRKRALMGPIINPGQRQYPTTLDRAALLDVGWEEALPGDANLDRQFDVQDLLQVLQSGKYEADTLATWADGDWNDDLRFDKGDILAALRAGIYASGPYAAMSGDRLANYGSTSLIDDDAKAASAQVGGGRAFVDLATVPVPEPSTLLSACLGVVLMLFLRDPRA